MAFNGTFNPNSIDPNVFFGSMLGTGVMAFLIALGILLLLLLIAVYIYFALAWSAIAKKMKHKKPWLAWIPFANIAMWLQMGEFHWAWIFLIVVPILGWIPLAVLFIISNYRVFEKLKYPGWLSFALIIGMIPYIGWIGTIAYMTIMGIVAWKK